MTDIRADEGTPLDDDDRLPWLEAVDEDEGGDGPSALKLIAYVLIGLVVIGAIVGGVFWMGNRDGQETRDAQLIQAPEGDYKVRPDDPGGMAVEGEGGTAFAASEGADPKGSIDTNAVAEAPVTQAKQPPAPKTPAAPPAAPKQAPPAPASGPSIQLGAFSSQAGANAAWTALSQRFRYLAPLSHTVVPVQVGGRTLYRLRASGPDAASVCRRLQAAGDACSVVSWHPLP